MTADLEPAVVADPEADTVTQDPDLGPAATAASTGATFLIHVRGSAGNYLPRTQLRVRYTYHTSSGAVNVPEYLPVSNAHSRVVPYYAGDTSVTFTVRHTTLGTKTQTVQNQTSGTFDVHFVF